MVVPLLRIASSKMRLLSLRITFSSSNDKEEAVLVGRIEAANKTSLA